MSESQQSPNLPERGDEGEHQEKREAESAQKGQREGKDKEGDSEGIHKAMEGIHNGVEDSQAGEAARSDVARKLAFDEWWRVPAADSSDSDVDIERQRCMGGSGVEVIAPRSRSI